MTDECDLLKKKREVEPTNADYLMGGINLIYKMNILIYTYCRASYGFQWTYMFGVYSFMDCTLKSPSQGITNGREFSVIQNLFSGISQCC